MRRNDEPATSGRCVALVARYLVADERNGRRLDTEFAYSTLQAFLQWLSKKFPNRMYVRIFPQEKFTEGQSVAVKRGSKRGAGRKEVFTFRVLDDKIEFYKHQHDKSESRKLRNEKCVNLK